MTLRGSLLVFGMGTVLAWGAWLLILFSVEPAANGMVGELFFFGSLFLAITGTLTILGVLGRNRASSALPSIHLAAAFRQGALIAIATVGALVLRRFQYLRWWNILLLGGALVMLDLALTRRRRPPGLP